MTLQTYRRTRARGFAPWTPRAESAALVQMVRDVLDEYRSHLPLTIRQVFYRLVGTVGYEKIEKGYGRLAETLNRARRAGLIPFSAIRDDGAVSHGSPCFDSPSDFLDEVRAWAEDYRRNRLDGQPYDVELWCEAAGMAPQLVRVAEPYGVTVYSSGGFDSLTVKHGAAQRIARRDRSTIVLHVGDLDPSGHAIFDSLSEDVTAFVDELGEEVEFRRAAVTREQADRYELPTAPAKATDRRGDFDGETVQAEALPPDVLAREVEAAIASVIDEETRQAVLTEEAEEREELTLFLEGFDLGGAT